MGSISGQGTKFPQAEEQLSPGATELRSPCTAKREACTLPLRSHNLHSSHRFHSWWCCICEYFPFGHVFSGIFWDPTRVKTTLNLKPVTPLESSVFADPGSQVKCKLSFNIHTIFNIHTTLSTVHVYCPKKKKVGINQICWSRLHEKMHVIGPSLGLLEVPDELCICSFLIV